MSRRRPMKKLRPLRPSRPSVVSFSNRVVGFDSGAEARRYISKNNIKSARVGHSKEKGFFVDWDRPVDKKMTYKQYSNKDSDGDGIKNKDDCRPFDRNKQGVIHDTIEKIKSKIAESKKRASDKRASDIERERAEVEQLRHEQSLRIQKEKLSLDKMRAVERQKSELAELKRQRRELQLDNDLVLLGQSPLGKVSIAVGEGATLVGSKIAKSLQEKRTPASRRRKKNYSKKKAVKRIKKKKKRKSRRDSDDGYLSFV